VARTCPCAETKHASIKATDSHGSARLTRLKKIRSIGLTRSWFISSPWFGVGMVDKLNASRSPRVQMRRRKRRPSIVKFVFLYARSVFAGLDLLQTLLPSR
jgi:hypothetical protein